MLPKKLWTPAVRYGMHEAARATAGWQSLFVDRSANDGRSCIASLPGISRSTNKETRLLEFTGRKGSVFRQVHRLGADLGERAKGPLTRPKQGQRLVKQLNRIFLVLNDLAALDKPGAHERIACSCLLPLPSPPCSAVHTTPVRAAGKCQESLSCGPCAKPWTLLPVFWSKGHKLRLLIILGALSASNFNDDKEKQPLHRCTRRHHQKSMSARAINCTATGTAMSILSRPANRLLSPPVSRRGKPSSQDYTKPTPRASGCEA